MIDVIIFGGQSNMQGQAEALTESATVEGAFEYKYISDTLVPLANPVGENITYDGKEGITYTDDYPQDEWLKNHVLGSSCYGHTNMVPEFCRKYIGETGRNVIAVHAAKGSTEASCWLPESDGYRMLSKKASGAIRKAEEKESVGHVYFVWLQGESDAVYSRKKDDYKQKLNLIFDALKKDVGVERFCIVRVGRFTNDERDLEIIEAQNELCSEGNGFCMLTEIATDINKDPMYMNPFVCGHYSARGLELLGSVSGRALGKIANFDRE